MTEYRNKIRLADTQAWRDAEKCKPETTPSAIWQVTEQCGGLENVPKTEATMQACFDGFWAVCRV